MIDFKEEFYQKCEIKSEHQLTRYLTFVLSSKRGNSDSCEKHHILPSSIFPEFTLSDFNIAKLSTREHFIAHLILAEAVGGKMWMAIAYMCDAKPGHYNRNSVTINSRLYEKCKRNAAQFISENIKITRSKETVEQKNARSDKWKLKFYAKTEKEKEDIWEKQRITRRKLNCAGLGNLPKMSCINCKKQYQHVKSFDRHICKKELSDIKKQEKIAAAISKQVIINIVSQLKHVSIHNMNLAKAEKQNKKAEEIMIKKQLSVNSKTCKTCNKFFSSNKAFSLHSQINNCHLTKEEQKKLSRDRARTTANSRSAEEKDKTKKILSDKRKEYLKSLPADVKNEYHEKLRNSAKKYYTSEKYDASEKSQQVKLGLINAKDIKNRGK